MYQSALGGIYSLLFIGLGPYVRILVVTHREGFGMADGGLEEVFARWSQDEDFRNRFRTSPQGAVREEGIDLSDDEWATLHGMDLEGLEDHHLKQRVSKSAFALGKLLGLGAEGPGVGMGAAGSTAAGSSLEGSALAGSVERGLEGAGLTGGSLTGRSAEGASLDGSSAEPGSAEDAAT